MRSPTHDRMARALVDFIHCKARSIADEIARAEAAIRAIPEVTNSADGMAPDSMARCVYWQLRERVEELQALSSLSGPRLWQSGECGIGPNIRREVSWALPGSPYPT